MIPADVLDYPLCQQSGLTGESDAAEKVCLRKLTAQNLDSPLKVKACLYGGPMSLPDSLVLVVGMQP